MIHMRTACNNFLIFSFAMVVLASCSAQQKIAKQAKQSIFKNAAFKGAHVGISVYNAATNKYLYNYQGDKYFVPASNTKLFTCYAAMKYLGDSITAARYSLQDGDVYLQATGDPTFLHPDFATQRLFNFLKQPSIKQVFISTPFAAEPLGRGWAWDDYTEEYMAERDPFPMYGNVATISYRGDTLHTIPANIKSLIAGEVNTAGWNVTRKLGGHFYSIVAAPGNTQNTKAITMAMEKGSFAARYLADTLQKEVVQVSDVPGNVLQDFYSQPTDSLLKITMHRSDNFFAEQTLLMVSNKLIGSMNDYKITDTLLKTIYADAPQKPKWVDGSGLSRYNLFTPQDFVWLVNKMQADFGTRRVMEILPTGGEGTLSSLYKNYKNQIFAKTGTLSNHVALSGLVITKKGKTLIFSFLVNAHQSTAANIRHGIEAFVTSLIDKY